MRLPVRTGALLAALAVITSTPRAQVPRSDSLAYRRRILGVYDPTTGDPISGVRVLDSLRGESSLTTITGTVTLAFLPTGSTTLKLQKLGYKTISVIVNITPDNVAPITVELEKNPVPLPTVETRDTFRYYSPLLQGFSERSTLHQGGQYVTEKELRRFDTQRITAMVRRLSGITVDCPRTGSHRGECTAISQRLMTSRGRNTCPLSVYVDGASLFDPDLEKLFVRDFSGIELYAGGASVPPQFNKTNNIC